MVVDLLARVRAEIDARLAELRPAVAEYERLLGADGASAAPRGAVEQAIAAALEHGSHTLGELVLVTAIPGAEIREGLRRLRRAGAVTRAKRDGRAAYALTGAA